MADVLFLSTHRSDLAMIAPLLPLAEVHLPGYRHRLIASSGTASHRVAAHIIPRIEQVETACRGNVAALVIAGDRYEQVCCGVLAQQYGIPILHLGGGEMRAVKATPDTRHRNCLTMLASAHAVFTKEAFPRVADLVRQQTPEGKLLLKLTGSPALDRIKPGRLVLESRRYAIIAYHPQPYATKQQEDELRLLGDIVTWLSMHLDTVHICGPNIDKGGLEIVETMKSWCLKNGGCCYHDTYAGDFVELMRGAAIMVGNSSAGRIEASIFGTPVLEIGNRQVGRPHPANVVPFVTTGNQVDDAAGALKCIQIMLDDTPTMRSTSPWQNQDRQASSQVIELLGELLERGKGALET